MDLNNMHRTLILILGISLTVSAHENSQLYVPCKQGWYLLEEKCYKVLGLNETEHWVLSENKCWLEESGDLASIHSTESQEFLTVFLLLTAKSNVWIGLHDTSNESIFSWEDGSNFNYTNWDTLGSRPWSLSIKRNSQNRYDCVTMQYHVHKSRIGTWADQICDGHSLPYICQVNKSADANSPDPRFCSFEEGGGWKFFNSCYHVVQEEKSWEDAAKYCEDKFKGYLVTISDSEKEMFINYIHKSNLPKDVWIGIKLQNNVISQKWASGWHVAYNSWNQKPLRFESGSCALKSIQNSWEVKPCLDKHPFICEKIYNVPVMKSYPSNEWKCPNSSIKWLDLEGDSCYYVETAKRRNWLEANHECGRIGGALASFHSEEETNILHPHVIADRQRLLFIGLKRSSVNNDVFEWADGTEVNYENWGSSPYMSDSHRHCVSLWTHKMDWTAAYCDNSHGYICKSKKVFSKMKEIATPVVISEFEELSTPVPYSSVVSMNQTYSVFSKMKEISTPVISEFEKFSTPVPYSSVVSMNQTYSGGIPAGTVGGIVFCTILVVLLVGVIVYHSRNFWNIYCMKTLNVGFTPAPDSVGLISDKVTWKPLKKELHN